MKTVNKTTENIGVFNNKTLTTAIQERIVSLVSRKGGEWSGNMTELMRALKSVSGKVKATLPTSPSVMRKVLNEALYSIRRSGVSVAFTRTSDSMRKRVVEFVKR